MDPPPGGFVFILLEYMAGGSMESHLGSNTSSAGHADRWRIEQYSAILSFLADAAAGLVHMSLANPPVVHRDLACRNILLDGDHKRAKVADFGLAHTKQTNGESGSDSRMEVRPVPWMAPEQLDEPPQCSIMTDVYSLGCTIAEALTAQRPWPQVSTLQAIIMKKAHGETPPLPVWFPAQLVSLVTSCCHTDASQRPKIDAVQRTLGDMAHRAAAEGFDPRPANKHEGLAGRRSLGEREELVDCGDCRTMALPLQLPPSPRVDVPPPPSPQLERGSSARGRDQLSRKRSVSEPRYSNSARAEPIYEGWLLKSGQGGGWMFDSTLFGGGWQKRWFKLFDTEMTYQTSPNGAWKGSIDFSSCGYSFEEEDAVLSGGSLLRDCRVRVRQTGRLAVQLADAEASSHSQKGSYYFGVVGVDGKLFRVRSFELCAVSTGDTDAKEACGCWCDNITAVLLMVHSKLSISKWARGHLPFLLKAGCDAMIDQCSKVGITTVDHLLAKGLDEVLALLQDCPTVKGDCLRLLKNTLAKMMKARIDLQALAFKKSLLCRRYTIEGNGKMGSSEEQVTVDETSRLDAGLI